MKDALKLALEALETELSVDMTNGAEVGEAAEKMCEAITAIKAALAQPEQEPDYAYPTIEEYEEITGFKVNDTFRMGWVMARTTNDLFKQMEKNNG